MNNGNSSETQPGLLNPLNADELSRLELALDKIGPSWGIAARLMGRLGLRVGEVQKLSWKHVEIYPSHDSIIHITSDITKTGYARDLPIPSTLCELIIEQRHRARAAWFERSQQEAAIAGETLFLQTPVIQKNNDERPSVRWMQMLILSTSKKVIGRRVKPHTLRHTFATRLLQETNIRVVQAALGHRSLRSTQIYTHPTMTDLRDAIEKAGGQD